MRVADVLMLVIDLSEDPDVQAELLIEQITDWKIQVTKKGEGIQEKEALYKPGILAANKSDLPGTEEKLKGLRQKYESIYPVVGISATQKKGFEELRRVVFEKSRIIRVYAKEPGKAPDMDTPFTLPVGSVVLDLTELIHKDFVKNLKYARICGSAEFDGQRAQKDYILHDRDVVEYHL